MAGRLSHVASQIMGGNGIVSRSVASSLRLRSGMGLPVGKHIVPDKPLPVNDELVWDNGTPFPEPCIDRIADTVGKYEALAWLCGGLSFFASLGLLAVWNDKASTIPFETAASAGEESQERAEELFWRRNQRRKGTTVQAQVADLQSKKSDARNLQELEAK